MTVEPFALESPDGLTLRGERWAAAQAAQAPPAVAFVHGNGFAVQAYRPAWAPLTGRVGVHALNLRGHGGSAVPESLADWEPLYADWRHFVERRLSPPVWLAGHSLGAMLALRLASERPALARGLILLDPLVPLPREARWPEAGEGPEQELIERTLARRYVWPHRAAAHDWLAGRGAYRHWDAAALEAFCAAGLADDPAHGVALACPPWLEAAIFAGRPDKAEAFRWAEGARAPAVVVRGADSLLAHPRGCEQLAGALPVATVLTVAGGHSFAMARPASTARALAMALDLLQGE